MGIGGIVSFARNIPKVYRILFARVRIVDDYEINVTDGRIARQYAKSHDSRKASKHNVNNVKST